ncbi:MAG TPA: response regulator transcription factor [Flavisolibacter sp.]|nr:response regulator transcription factor [Flavisolibacter sp.]
MKKTTILIVDDHQLLRQTWSFVLNTDRGYEVIGDCSNASEAIKLAAALRPDIILLDINLPGISGIEAVPHLINSSPGSKIVGVSMHIQPAYARRMIKDGAMGYVCKNSSSSEMLKALSEIRDGKKYICQEIKEELAKKITSSEEADRVAALSRREIEITRLIKQGLSSKEIAQQLFISVKTVEAHRYKILKKLKLKNTAALVNFINATGITGIA